MYRGTEQDWTEKFIVGFGAFIGTLVLGFSYSFWFNSVESEVYAAATFFTAITMWLIMVWQDYADEPKGDKILLLIAYTIGLATGVHLLNLLALWTLFQIVYFRKFKFTWSGFILQIALASVAFLIIYPGIIKYIPNSALKFSVWAPLLVILALVFGLYYAHKNRQRIIALSLLSILLITLGYSTYGVIFVRSGLEPRIDENNPDNLDRLVYYLNREQYGDAPIFDRRWNGGPPYTSKFDFFWRYQIHHMYTRYFLWQFVGMEGDFQGAGVDFPQYWALPLLVGFLGMAWHFQRDSKRAFSVLSLFFLAGYGIVLYLNQEDPQPRERDYSYVGSFYAFAIWIGIGASYLLELTQGMLKKKKGELQKVGFYAVSAALFALLPLNMLIKNYDTCKRTGEYVASDYSHNILQSCDKDGIIFTNGDNDTFPLWYLQEVEGVRRDIRVVNLSLLNTGWYIKQLKNQEPKVPINLTEDYIDKYIDGHDWESLKNRYWPKTRTVSIPTPEGTYEWQMNPTMHIQIQAEDTGERNFIRVQDLMILDILYSNQGKKPVYFAVTVSNENMIGLREYLRMEGLAFRVSPVKSNLAIEPEKMRVALFEKFDRHYRNLDNPKVHFNDNIVKLLQNYRSAFLQLAYHYYQLKQPGYTPQLNEPLSEQYAKFDSLSSDAKTNLILRWMEKKIPEKVIPLENDEILAHLGRMYYDIGFPEELEKRLDKISARKTDWQKKLGYAAMYKQFLNKEDKALNILENTMRENKGDDKAIVEIVTLMGRIGNEERAVGILDSLMTANPSDELKLSIATGYYQLRKDSSAISIYQELIAKDNSNGQAVGGLLALYERNGKFQEALNLVENWLTLHPSDAQAEQKRIQLEQMVKMIATQK
jgi:tetratricopeptide (TPR) repeat protein